jgi:hypothetical protein
MNMPPDDAMLALWLEDELDGEDFAKVEAWAQSQPDQLAMRESARKWKAMISAGIPATEEPPYPDFFNARIARSISQQKAQQAPEAKPANSIPFWRKFALPLAAGVGMAFTFWLGIHSRSIPVVESIAEMTAPGEMTQLADASENLPATVYTPENGVRAKCFDSDAASATVVILEGLAAIPKETDLTRQTAATDAPREIDSTAQAELPASKDPKP